MRQKFGWTAQARALSLRNYMPRVFSIPIDDDGNKQVWPGQRVVMQDCRLVGWQVEQTCALSFGQNKASWHGALGHPLPTLWQCEHARKRASTLNNGAIQYQRPLRLTPKGDSQIMRSLILCVQSRRRSIWW